VQPGDRTYLLYVVVTNYLTIFSGVLFLLAFIVLGLIALRVSRVFGVRTAWGWLFAGPVGALVYSVYTIVHRAPAGLGGGSQDVGPTGSQAAYALERWIAYGAFVACGVLCWWGMYRFYRALDALEREGREVKKKYG
jgi:hypothetical protein